MNYTVIIELFSNNVIKNLLISIKSLIIYIFFHTKSPQVTTAKLCKGIIIYHLGIDRVVFNHLSHTCLGFEQRFRV